MYIDVMSAVLYTLLSVLVIILIFVALKLMNTLDKVNKVVDDVEKKLSSLNIIFNGIDFVTDKLAGVSDILVNNVSSFIGKLFKKKKKGEYENE